MYQLWLTEWYVPARADTEWYVLARADTKWYDDGIMAKSDALR